MDDVKEIKFTVPKYIHFNFKNKCRFYEMTYGEVLSFMVEKFIEGDFDSELGIGENKDEGHPKQPG